MAGRGGLPSPPAYTEPENDVQKNAVRPVFQPDPFEPAALLANAHAQTISGRFLRRAPLPAFRRERIDTSDGDFLDLDFVTGVPDSAPLVVLFHGLEGSARRGYAVNTYRMLAERGIAALGVNFRSCSGEMNRTARFYHSGETGDIGFVLSLLRARFPDRRIGVIGFSLGGNALLKYLGEQGEAARRCVDAAVAVSVPYDLGAGARLLDTSAMGRFYTGIFVKSLIRKIELKAHLLPDGLDLERVRKARSFYDFDDAITAPLHGFNGADDYYARSSSYQFIGAIRIPTLLLQAEDDPFIPRDAIPRKAAADNPCITAVITERGGHVGFISGTIRRPVFWAEHQAARFFESQLTQ